MKISRDEVRNVALLARLALTDDEEAAVAADLDQMLTYVDLLNELDTTEIAPTAHVVAIEAPFREDAVTNAPATEALLAVAPARDGTSFKVPKIIE
jgi:aspartyl-tRNA(Asn)/glutamyl-tRNA(Gln) amidotransferase subunit C